MAERIDISQVKNAHFIGIGGIGMSALARYLNSRGVNVSGYDRVSSSITDGLQSEGIDVHFSDDIALLPESVDLVVYTPAVPASHVQLNHYRKSGPEPVKRAELLGRISRQQATIAVAGTHGKTTVSTMLAHLLHSAGKSPSAFLGGISLNIGSNLLLGEGDWMVAEADEYDRSFLQLKPKMAVITAMDADHLDIYGKAGTLEDTFREFASLLPGDGLLLARHALRGKLKNLDCRVLTYDLNDPGADIRARQIECTENAYYFSIQWKGSELGPFALPSGGRHNVENMLAAAGIALELGLDEAALAEGIAGFKGIRRRFEYRIRTDQLVFIDDYAHHPTELDALISSVRERYPDKRLTLVFQPHLYTRTRDFAPEFKQSLKQADQLLLLPIYPAREEPIEGVRSEMLFERTDNAELVAYGELVGRVAELKPELLVTAGAGDIDRLLEPLVERLTNKNESLV